MKTFFTFVLPLCLSVLVSSPALSASCESSSFRLSADFSAGQLGECRVRASDHFVLSLMPEISPINNSPWYAFKVSGQKGSTAMISLYYGEFRHRYDVKSSLDGINWQRLDPKLVAVSEGRHHANFEVTLPEETVWIAAQPLLVEQDYQKWLADWQRLNAELEVFEFGKSIEGRRLNAVRLKTCDTNPVIVLLGRQHPPEITGAFAFKTFIDTLLNESVSSNFLQRFTVLAMPLINPDGVEHGFWRTNMNGKDLNRDWGPFSQPETQQVMALINQELETGPLWAMLDFHSTFKNVLYTAPDAEHSTLPGFMTEWTARINNGGSPIQFIEEASHKATRTNAKSYFHEHFGVPAVTFEIDDEAELDDINQTAAIAAQAFMAMSMQRVAQQPFITDLQSCP